MHKLLIDYRQKMETGTTENGSNKHNSSATKQIRNGNYRDVDIPRHNNDTLTSSINRTRRVSLDHDRIGLYHKVNNRHRSSICPAAPSLVNTQKSREKARTLPRTSGGTNRFSELDMCWLKQAQTLLQNKKLLGTLIDELNKELNTLCIGENGCEDQNEQSRRISQVFDQQKGAFTSEENTRNGNSCIHSINNDKLSTRRRQSFANIELYNRMPAARARSHSIVHGHSDHLQNVDHLRRLANTRETHCHGRERRSSHIGNGISRPSHVITRITSVQKRLFKIHRQRRRNGQRNGVVIGDITLALKSQVNHNCTGDGCRDCDLESKQETECGPYSEAANIMETGDNDTTLSVADTDPGVAAQGNMDCQKQERGLGGETTDTSEDNQLYYQPRRRCSIQARSWEISRRLRQRRREKRKYNAMVRT